MQWRGPRAISPDGLGHDAVVPGRLEKLFRRWFQVVEDQVHQRVRALFRDVKMAILRGAVWGGIEDEDADVQLRSHEVVNAGRTDTVRPRV